jgi:transcriptional regulator
MHPDGCFHWNDKVAMRACVEQVGFAHIFVPTLDAPMVIHAPLVIAGDAFRFHLARRNRARPFLDGARVLASVVTGDGYVSPDWYDRRTDQVPTWNYVAVEIEGTARLLDDDALLAQIDRLSDVHEATLDPKPRWTRDKVSASSMKRMLAAIEAYEIGDVSMRGTRKLNQNKSAADRAGVAEQIASPLLAQMIREL